MLDPRPARKDSGVAGKTTFKRGTVAIWLLKAENPAIIRSQFSKLLNLCNNLRHTGDGTSMAA